ncbi:MAG: DNA mismatch repair endonuclease MutL [Clostridia bacterium]|nr:DNA mismatch repair endonuclease MutL [Clostridia bacterium]
MCLSIFRLIPEVHMPDINILSPHVADLIAAGEVVERPASVIKELMENSFDAGARNITIELKNGGMTYIRVSDDGSGMLPEDAGICFMRHATSKLKDERGLEAIGTMGFRGEALAAISAVSNIEMLTRRRGEQEGTRVLVSSGDIQSMAPCGCPEGTTIIVRDLFRNTPARLKFMKSDRSEAGACVGIALRCALGRPEISVRLIRDGSEEFFTPGDGKLSSVCYSLLGRELASDLLEICGRDDFSEVSGFVGSPRAGHGNRAKQFFFVNGRCIKSALLQSAVEQAYKNTLLTGRYPAAVVCLTVSPAAVDVNVHPAKTEVKFRDEKHIFDAVYYSALSALKSEGSPAETTHFTSASKDIAAVKDFFKTMPAEEFRKKYGGAAKSVGAPTASHLPAEKSPSTVSGHKVPPPSQARFNDGAKAPYAPRTFVPAPAGIMVSPAKESDKVSPPEQTVISQSVPAQTVLSETASSQTVISETIPDYRLIGETMKTYILIEQGDKLILIDKHAAHERMIFDRLKAEGRQIMSQSLLMPVTVKLSSGDMELMEQSSELLSGLGFEIDPYGDDSVILRGVPADTDAADASAMLEEICQKLSEGKSVSQADRVDEILHTVSCKAAIKAGWNTADDELIKIADAVVSGKVKYCPHGRPVSFTLTKSRLDKEFSRIV